ncbi:MAG TPA: hypothetical protein VF205_02160 [Nitrospiraceae bacterium]
MTGVVPTGTIAGLSLRPTVSGLAAIEYLLLENLSITAHFDFYSSPFSGTNSAVLDHGITEAVPGFSYRMAPHFLWQLYAVENLDFYIGSSPDLRVSTVFSYRFESGSSRQISGVASANPLTTWDSHVKLTAASVQAAKGLRQCLSATGALLQVCALTQRSVCHVDSEDHSKPG